MYADFSGRARRKEYWMFVLFNFIAVVLLFFVEAYTMSAGDLYLPLASLYSLATFIPSLAVSVRRLHDVGESGWMLLVGLIPLIGSIWLLVLYLRKSEPGANKYGPNPKVATA